MLKRHGPKWNRARFGALSAVFLTGVVIGTSGSSMSRGSPNEEDPVIRAIWEKGMESSHVKEYAHTLLDRIGPRLAGSSGLGAAQDWLIGVYDSLGIHAEREQYGTWKGWNQGTLHVDLIHPRIETLEAEMLAWSPGTIGPVEGEVVLPPLGLTEETLGDWLASVREKFVLITAPEPMCRARQELVANARPSTMLRIDSLRGAIQSEWSIRMRVFGGWRERERMLDRAGAAGIISSRWSGGWGTHQVFETLMETGVGFDLPCEGYGLLVRLIENGVTPILRVAASSESLGEVPQYNVIATLPGSELPDEYVILGAHLDSWHSATGATDNGTGTITMLEAARILKEVYPAPRRTILIGHWGAEEFGLIGSSSFREDHPEVMAGLQAAFNQDNGTWRVELLEGQGFSDAVNHIPKWMAKVPRQTAEPVRLVLPGNQENPNSDHLSFLCAAAPSFRLQSSYDEYRQYTWHTNRDTFDKIVFDDLRENVILTAMLAYMASEDPQWFSRDRADLGTDPKTGRPREWVRCAEPQRSFAGGEMGG